MSTRTYDAVMPEAQAGVTLADGRPRIVLRRPDMMDETHASIARYSEADADTYVELKRSGQAAEQLFAAGHHSVPMRTDVDPQGMPTEGLFSDLVLSEEHALESPKMVIDEVLETDEMRTLMYRISIEWGDPARRIGHSGGVPRPGDAERWQLAAGVGWDAHARRGDDPGVLPGRCRPDREPPGGRRDRGGRLGGGCADPHR